MKTKQKVIILITLQSISTLLWALGLIWANFDFFIISLIISVIYSIPAIIYLDEITEFFKTKDGEVIADERKELIDGKAAIPAFVLMFGVSFYSGIAIITLRNIYPEYINLAYPFFIIAIIGLLSYQLSNIYYKRKFGD